MGNDNYFTIFISILIVINLLSKTRIYIRNLSVILHCAILLFIVFLFYVKFEKSALMTSLLYLIMYVQSYKLKEFLTDLPQHSLNKTMNPNDKIAESILVNNNLPSQIIYWYSADSFNSSPITKDIQWRDLVSNNHIQFESSNVKLNSSSTNTASGPKKWVSGDITTSLSIPLLSTPNDNVTFIHLTRYSPRTSNRGKMWSTENGMLISGYNDNKITMTNTDGVNILNDGGGKRGDIMNIRGSSWNIFIDQMNTSSKIRTVNVNGYDYIFTKELIGDMPAKIGLNVSSNMGDKTDWDCAEIMVYSRILDKNEVDQIISYFNKKYSIKYPEKIEESKYNIYNHYTFSSTDESDWKSLPSVGATTISGNKLLGITDTEYECVSLCDKNTTSCAAFTYDMKKGTCYSVDETNILNHTTYNKDILSGTNKARENSAQRAKEEAERLAREEAERQRLAAIEAERQRQVAEAAEAERQRLKAAAAEAERQRVAEEELEKIRQQKRLLNQDRFIPIFDSNSNEAMGYDGVYKVDIRYGASYPCYNMSTSGYINGGQYGSLLDNNDTTGVDIEKYGNCSMPYKIIITLPVEKTFQGTFSMRLIAPWTSKLPKRVSLVTYNANAFSESYWWQCYTENWRDEIYSLETMELGNVAGWGNGPYEHSFNVNFTRPFKHIALLIHSGWTQDGNTPGQAGAIWITSLNFMNSMSNSNVTSSFGKDVDNKKSFNCSNGHQISGFSAVTGGWMDQIQFRCTDGSESEKYGGKNRNFTDGDQNVNVTFASNEVKGFSINDTPNEFISSMGLIYNNGTKSSMMGGNWIRNNGSVECPNGKRIVGVDVNYDNYVSRIGIKCDNV